MTKSQSEHSISRRQFLKLIVGTGILAFSYPVVIERYLIQVNHYSIPVPHLPPEFEGFTIAHLTDIHYGPFVPLSILKWCVNKVNELEPDLAVFTGDLVHAGHDASLIEEGWPELSKLQAKSGVFSVLGNHDHWADTEQSLYWLEQSGQNIRHRSKPIQRGNNRIWIGGAGDLYEDVDGVDRAYQDCPEGDCKILLAHNPDTADLPRQTRVDLVISGHTHGGQIRLPILGSPVLPVRNKDYSSGLVRSGGNLVFISRGIGWALLPVRFNCRPEIAVLTLLQESS